MVQSPPDGFVGLCYVVFLSLWSLMSFTCPDYPAVCFLFQLSEFSHSSSVSSWFTLVFLFSFLPLFVFHAFCFFHLSIPSRPWTCVRGIYFWLNRLYFLWFWTMSSCVLWCEPRTFKHAWICADIRNIRKHKHNARQCKCFRTETCYMRKPNVETTDVIVSLQTCLSHNDESKSNVHSLFALFLVPVWNWNLSKVWWKPVELTLSLLREEQTFHQNCESKHIITQIVCLPVLLCDDLFLLQHS